MEGLGNKRVKRDKTISCSDDKKKSLDISSQESQKKLSSKKPFSCSDCEKRFSQKDYLLRHQKVHRGEKPFSCSDCGQCFREKGNLLTHKRVHTGEKPFICCDCEKRFSRKDHLSRHKKVHTGEKPFACTDCGKCFSDKDNFLRHKRVHIPTNEKPFYWCDCGRCFSHTGRLLSHQIHMYEYCEKCSYREDDKMPNQCPQTNEKDYIESGCLEGHSSGSLSGLNIHHEQTESCQGDESKATLSSLKIKEEIEMHDIPFESVEEEDFHLHTLNIKKENSS